MALRHQSLTLCQKGGTAMNQVKTFSHPLFGQVRTMVMTDGQIGFVGKDVAVALGYQNPSNAINIHVDNEDKTTYLIQVSGSNYKTKTTFINESGLYALVLSSRLPQAREFKHWVTAEVLPQIRRTGGYIPVGKDDKQDDLLRRAIAIYDKTVGIKDEIIGAQKAIIGKQTEVISKQMTTIGNLNGQLEEAQPKADYCDQVLASPSTFTMTEVAKDCSMTVHQLTQLLMRLRVIYRSPSGPYMLYAGYLHQGYESYRSRRGQDIFGNITWTDNYLVWTEKGRRFIHELINDFNQN